MEPGYGTDPEGDKQQPLINELFSPYDDPVTRDHLSTKYPSSSNEPSAKAILS